MSRGLWLLALAGCGRIGFGTPPDAGGSADASEPDTAPGVCGDLACRPSEGELCGNCMADCATLSPVCGNAACGPGEATTCFADCGPTPWTWIPDEQQLAMMINQARTSGLNCPTGPIAAVPALTVVATMLPGAREWVWEASHHDFYMLTGDACNGRTLTERRNGGGFSGFLITANDQDVAAAFNTWATSTGLCPIIMDTNVTTMSVAVAIDVNKTYLVVTK